MSVFRNLLTQLLDTGGLPKEYQQVEYIQSDGSQYIETNYSVNINTEVIFDFQDEFVNRYENYFGVNNQFRLQRSGTSSTRFNWMVSATDNNFTASFTSRRKLTFNKNGIFDENGNAILNKQVGTISSNFTMVIFNAYYYGLDAGGVYKLYGFEINENGELKRNFIPCYRKSDNVIGLYDTITKLFYTNQGSGTFLKGGDV